jgi:hypothetical protein
VFPYFVLGLALLLGFWLMGKWFVGAEPKTVITGLRWTVAGLAVGLVLYVLVVGSYGLVIAALGALFPVIMAIVLGRRRAKATRGPSPGRQSEVNTRFLRMTLDHDSGEMTGVVRRGSFEGAHLDDLGLSDLLSLWQECRGEDPQSAAVLEAYLDRRHAETWRDAAEERFDGAGARRPTDGGTMSQEEALEILGLEKDPGEADIIEAHRRLMQKVHPDHGGSNYLASKINEAKDLLLKRSRS